MPSKLPKPPNIWNSVYFFMFVAGLALVLLSLFLQASMGIPEFKIKNGNIRNLQIDPLMRYLDRHDWIFVQVITVKKEHLESVNEKIPNFKDTEPEEDEDKCAFIDRQMGRLVLNREYYVPSPRTESNEIIDEYVWDRTFFRSLGAVYDFYDETLDTSIELNFDGHNHSGLRYCLVFRGPFERGNYRNIPAARDVLASNPGNVFSRSVGGHSRGFPNSLSNNLSVYTTSRGIHLGMTRNEVIAILGEPSEYQELESPERNTRDLIYRSMFDEDPCVYMYYYAHYSFDENDELIGFLLYDGKPRKWQHWEPYFKAMDPPHLVKFPM